MVAWLRRLWRATIWHPAAIPADEQRKYATPLKRFLFPAFDMVMLAVGLRGLDVGIPSIERIFPAGVTTGYYLALVVFSVVCFIGAAFPRLWALEIAGKVTLFGVLAVYLLALRTVDDGGARDAVSLLIMCAMLIPLLRLWILGIEIRDRRGT